MEHQRIKFYSLDFLIFAHERRLEEEELLDEGYIEECERSSYSEMRKSYVEYLRELD